MIIYHDKEKNEKNLVDHMARILIDDIRLIIDRRIKRPKNVEAIYALNEILRDRYDQKSVKKKIALVKIYHHKFNKKFSIMVCLVVKHYKGKSRKYGKYKIWVPIGGTNYKVIFGIKNGIRKDFEPYDEFLSVYKFLRDNGLYDKFLYGGIEHEILEQIG